MIVEGTSHGSNDLLKICVRGAPAGQRGKWLTSWVWSFPGILSLEEPTHVLLVDPEYRCGVNGGSKGTEGGTGGWLMPEQVRGVKAGFFQTCSRRQFYSCVGGGSPVAGHVLQDLWLITCFSASLCSWYLLLWSPLSACFWPGRQGSGPHVGRPPPWAVNQSLLSLNGQKSVVIFC